MKFLAVLGLITLATAAAVPDDWNTWCATTTATSYYPVTTYLTETDVVTSTETSYVTNTETSYVTNTVTSTETDVVTSWYPYTTTAVGYSTITETAPCTTTGWGRWI